MNNLYVFAIGGSGERVLKSLIMLLSSGMQIGANQIIPVFIDNDTTSNALTTCLDLIQYYNSDPATGAAHTGANTIYNNLSNNPDDWASFFRTKIAEPIILNRSGNAIGNLQTIIGNLNQEDPIHSEIAEELDLLFTPDDLQMPLNVGFIGNPNIGSVVLNSLSLGDEDFDAIKSKISNTDGIFVIGSLFGGTGAAGFPLIVNTFNSLPAPNKPIIGGVAVLPYFSTDQNNPQGAIVDNTKWDVSPDTFDTKTRAALMFYDQYMKSLDYLYYVGDGSNKDTFSHCIGSTGQKNPTHIVEVMSALSIIDFSNQNRNNGVVYKTPIWAINTRQGELPINFSCIINSDLKKALAKFTMMKQIIRNSNFLRWAIDQNKDYVRNIGFTNSHLNSLISANDIGQHVYSWGVNNLIEEWSKWMEQLSRPDARRQMLLFNHGANPTDSNITTLFYTDSNFGIAKTERRYQGIFPFGHQVETNVDAKIADALQSAYRRLFPKGSSEDAMRFEEAKKLPTLLKIISDALDDVLAQKCIAL